METNSSGATVYTYDQTGIIMSNSMEKALYLKNAHGDVTSTASISGTVQNTYAYDAFGNQLNENTNDANPFRYCGEYYDNESGLIYLRNRYYDSDTGRFITEDPIKDGLNWYAYANNDPILFVDPTGTSAINALRDFNDIVSKYGGDTAWRVYNASERAKNNALAKAELWGYTETWDNEIDAMRHFQWNAVMAREIGRDVAKYSSDVHEVNNAKELGLFRKEVNGVVWMRANQSTLMDLWNNSVGITLGTDQYYNDMNYDQLFNMAKADTNLITDVNTVFDFYGILDYVDEETWTVGIRFNRGSNVITVMKEGLEDLALEVGINSWW